MPLEISWKWYTSRRTIGNRKMKAITPTNIYTIKSPTTLSFLKLICTVKTTPIIKQDTISTTSEII